MESRQIGVTFLIYFIYGLIIYFYTVDFLGAFSIIFIILALIGWVFFLLVNKINDSLCFIIFTSFIILIPAAIISYAYLNKKEKPKLEVQPDANEVSSLDKNKIKYLRYKIAFHSFLGLVFFLMTPLYVIIQYYDYNVEWYNQCQKSSYQPHGCSAPEHKIIYLGNLIIMIILIVIISIVLSLIIRKVAMNLNSTNNLEAKWMNKALVIILFVINVMLIGIAIYILGEHFNSFYDIVYYFL